MGEKRNDKRGYKATALILGGASTFMLVFILLNIFNNGLATFMNGIGFNQSASEIPLAWVIAAIVTIGYIAFTTFGMSTVKENSLGLIGLKRLEFMPLLPVAFWKSWSLGGC